jgi:uncharacterized protein YndB with AHSA1/START domain
MDKIRLKTFISIQSPLEIIWEKWNNPADIKQWYHAGDDWHTPEARNDLQTGGQFSYTMAAKDGSFSFDYEGIYDEVIEHQFIKYHLADGREVEIEFTHDDGFTEIHQTFDPENQNPQELQQQGWQMIQDNFKKHVEAIG